MRRPAALLVLFGALAVLHTWPLASNPAGLSRLDNDDTGLNTWIVAWVGHSLPRAPLQLFDAPMFYPERRTLAYSEHMLAPSLMGAPLLWSGFSAVLVYNLLALAGLALSGWTMSLLVGRWTGSTAAGVVSGMLFAFNAHLLTRFVHLQALHVEFLPIVLFAFDEVVRGVRLRRATVLLAVAFVLQGLCSNYSLVFVSAALLVAAAVRGPEWIGRRERTVGLALAGLASIVVLMPFLWPYALVRREAGLVRSIDEVRLYSAGLLDYLTTGGRLHYAWWSHRFFAGRTSLFPGVVASVLAVVALSTPPTRRDPRVRMMAAIGVTGVALSFGPSLPGYTWLHDHVLLLQGIRGAARWGFLLLTAVAVLAGYGVASLQRRWGRSTYWTAIVLALTAVVTLEALRAPMGFVPFSGIPPIYDALRRERRAVLVEVPMYHGRTISENARYLVAATRHFRPLVNGYSGFEPPSYIARAERWRAFPSMEVLEEMRALGVTHVMLHLADVDSPTATAAAASTALSPLADDGERRLYVVRP